MQNIGQRRIFSIEKIYFPLRVIFLFTWNKITLRFTDRCYSLKVDPILVFFSLLVRRSCDSSSVVHGIIIFSDQRAVNKTIVTEWVAGVPREITWFPRENSCKRVRPLQPFFLPSDLPRSPFFSPSSLLFFLTFSGGKSISRALRYYEIYGSCVALREYGHHRIRLVKTKAAGTHAGIWDEYWAKS